MNRHMIDDLARLVHPLPRQGEVDPPEAFDDALDHAQRQQDEWAANLDAMLDATAEDPLLAAIDGFAGQRDQAEAAIRLLVAYGRHGVGGRGYSVAVLAEAAGMDRKTLERRITEDDVAAVRALVDPAPPAADAPPATLRAGVEAGMRAVFDRMAVQYGLARLDWTLEPWRDGHPSVGPVLVGQVSRADHGDDAARAEIARAWAEHLGLSPAADPVAHTAAWQGHSDGLSVEVWTISDSPAWDTAG